MSRNLLAAGYDLVVHDVAEDPVKELVAAGADRADSPSAVAAQSDVIITMLPNSPEVEEVVLGANGVIEGIRKGSILIDMSSIAPGVSKSVAQQLAGVEVPMLDAPVSGGEPKAIDGTLSVMVGGPEEVFNKCKPILEAMADSVVLTGDVGSGNITKLANQIIVALNIAAVSEALVLAAKAGVDPKRVYEAIRGGLAGSTVLDAKAPLMIERSFQPGFRIDLHFKDLDNALKTAHEIGVPVPLSASALEILQALRVAGMGSLDHGAIVRFYEKSAMAEVGG
jgi:2-hydroxy-3-oxopropionate reductase